MRKYLITMLDNLVNDQDYRAEITIGCLIITASFILWFWKDLFYQEEETIAITVNPEEHSLARPINTTLTENTGAYEESLRRMVHDEVNLIGQTDHLIAAANSALELGRLMRELPLYAQTVAANSDALPNLINLLKQTDNVAAARNAAAALGCFITNYPPIARKIAQTPGVLSRLVELTNQTDGSANNACSAVAALANLAREYPPCAEEIVQTHDALPNLINLLKQTDHLITACNAAAALAHLVKQRHLDAAIIMDTPSAFSHLIILRANENPRVARSAHLLLAVLMQYNTKAVCINVVNLIANTNCLATANAAAFVLSLFSYTEDGYATQFAQTTRVYDSLAALLSQKEDSRAATALTSLTRGHPPCAEEIAQTPGVLSRLVELTDQSDSLISAINAAETRIFLARALEQLNSSITLDKTTPLRRLVEITGKTDNLTAAGLAARELTASIQYDRSNAVTIADTPHVFNNLVNLMAHIDTPDSADYATETLFLLIESNPPCAEALAKTPGALSRLSSRAQQNPYEAATMQARATLNLLFRHYPPTTEHINAIAETLRTSQHSTPQQQEADLAVVREQHARTEAAAQQARLFVRARQQAPRSHCYSPSYPPAA